MSSSPTISFVSGSDRDLITADQAQALKNSGALIIDERRTRTRYFDGRFLAAKDEIRDQNYFLTRLADLGRAGGSGVVAGLLVDQAGPTSLRIHAGQGVTPAGETVIVPSDLTISLADIATTQQLDVTFGLSRLPADLARNRSGLYVIGLRPVEYTANPVASYPTSLNGPRSVQDGDIIEAAAVVLVPYIQQGNQGSADTRQSRVARSIFVDQGALGTPENVLPLAMIALDHGVVHWVDRSMVRREIGSGQRSVLGFGLSQYALSQAYLQQYVGQLNQIMQTRSGSNQGAKFAASDYFEALPAAGVLPAAAIDPADFSQTFFPPQIQTDISIIPTDELAVLVEESYVLPSINLTDTADELESTSVLVLVPVPRTQLPALKAQLASLTNTLRPATPGLIFQRKPIQSLLGLTAVRLPPPVLPVVTPIDAVWRQALSQSPLLWYVRRKNLQTRADVLGAHVLVATSDVATGKALEGTLQTQNLLDDFNAVKAKSSAPAVTVITSALASPAVAANRVLAQSVIAQLALSPQIDQATALQITAPLTDPKLGEGLAQIQQAHPAINDAAVLQAVAASGAAVQLDQIGRSLNKAAVADVTNQVITLAKAGGTQAPIQIANLLKSKALVLNR